MSAADLIDRLELAIRRDPGHRGLLAAPADREGWLRGELAGAALDLAERGDEIAIVTGFAIPMPGGPVAETDGPPGAVLLADVLQALGKPCVLVTDEMGLGAVRCASVAAGLRDVTVEACPVEPGPAGQWIDGFLKTRPRLTHVVFVERVGPGHADVEIPPEHRGRCHNMRGEVIDGITAPLHRLLGPVEAVGRPVRSIGIGDGGNEIGMGRIPRRDLARRLPGPQAEWIPCSISTNWTVLCGVSNWGAMALAAAVSVRAGQPERVLAWTESRQRELLADLVARGPAVDGAKRAFQATVDGLSDEDYFGVSREIQALLRTFGEEVKRGAPRA